MNPDLGGGGDAVTLDEALAKIRELEDEVERLKKCHEDQDFRNMECPTCGAGYDESSMVIYPVW